MHSFCSVPLSSAARPILLEDEVELKNEDKVSIVHQERKKVKAEVYPAGVLILTNYRLITIVHEDNSNQGGFAGWGLDLKLICGVEDCAGIFRASSRVEIKILNCESAMGLRFEHKGKDDFVSMLNRALEKRSWESIKATNATLVDPSSEKSFSASNAGVSGIIRRQEQNLQSIDSITKSALTDLDALMDQAKEAIKVVQRYASYTQDGESVDSDAASSNHSETTSQREENNEMETIMQNIGIVSPVTKFTAGRLYHQQLARQMADLLLEQGRLQRLGGMITLTDLYCLFNKARGTELVSPEDLLRAAELCGSLCLGMRLRVFQSGVKILQSDACSEEAISQRILDMLQSDEEFRSHGVQASDVAAHMNISLIVAKEQLQIAEQKVAVCRDESVEGLYFFPNQFNSEKWTFFAARKP